MTSRKIKIFAAGAPDDNEELKTILTSMGHPVITAEKGREAMAVIMREKPDAVFIDSTLPDMTGYEVYRELVSTGYFSSLPFVFVYGKGGIIDELSCPEFGLFRYIEKPFTAKNLEKFLTEKQPPEKSRLKASPEKKNRINYIIDEMTGLYNRNYLDERLKEEFSRARRYGYPVSLAFLTLDDDQRIKNYSGRAQLNALIKQLADILRKNVRGIDILTRYSDESFAVLLPQTGRKGATVLGEKIRRIVERHLFFGVPGQNRFTASIGIAACNENDLSSISKITASAERALISARREGNKVTVVWI